MSDKLKPCPFCGGEAIVKGSIVTYNHVACRKCNTAMLGDTKEEAIKAWNTRPNFWHTGTPPTNESNVKNVFVLIYVSPDGKWSYNGNLFKADFENKCFVSLSSYKKTELPFDLKGILWQKIEPYEAST